MNTIFGLFAQLNDAMSSSAQARSILTGNQPAWPMASPRSRRVRHVGLGRLIQHPPPVRADRTPSSGRVQQAYYRAHETRAMGAGVM
jgi:hypothetical protein